MSESDRFICYSKKKGDSKKKRNKKNDGLDLGGWNPVPPDYGTNCFYSIPISDLVQIIPIVHPQANRQIGKSPT